MSLSQSRPARHIAALVVALVLATPAGSQTITPPGFHLPRLGPVTAETPAKELFGRVTSPADLPQESIGFYSKGCLAGASALPMSGPTWRVMRPSRHRNFGNRALIDFIERFSARVPQVSSWPGILVGDMAQPRGGPMQNGHASHQVGLDVDVWLKAMPAGRMSRGTRETLMSTNVVRADHADIDPRLWTPDHLAVIRAAAQDPQVTRIFVNPAIKKALCREATGDRRWMFKVRPMWGHDYHMHVRIACPPGATACRAQDPPADNDGCGADLAWWMTPGRLNPRPAPPPKVPPKPPHQITLGDLPPACRAVINAPGKTVSKAALAMPDDEPGDGQPGDPVPAAAAVVPASAPAVPMAPAAPPVAAASPAPVSAPAPAMHEPAMHEPAMHEPATHEPAAVPGEVVVPPPPLPVGTP